MTEPAKHVRLTQPRAGRPWVIEVEGIDVAHMVTEFRISSGAWNEPPELELGLHLLDGATFDAHARVVIPDETRVALIALGWTPPQVQS